MTSRIEYNGYVIEPMPRHKPREDRWSLEVRITPAGRRTGIRRCRAPNTYSTEARAIARCLDFGRQIVDGKLQPRNRGRR